MGLKRKYNCLHSSDRNHGRLFVGRARVFFFSRDGRQWVVPALHRTDTLSSRRCVINSKHNIYTSASFCWPAWTNENKLFRFELSPKLDSGADSSLRLSLIGRNNPKKISFGHRWFVSPTAWRTLKFNIFENPVHDRHLHAQNFGRGATSTEFCTESTTVCEEHPGQPELQPLHI